MGGKAFTVSCSLSSNGNTVTKVFALPDTGAHGFSFIDTHCATTVAKFLGVPLRKLANPIAIKGYNGKVGSSVTHYLQCTLVVDGRRLPENPFLVLDLGNHDVILGSMWFAHHDIKPDLRRRCLEWPESLPAKPYFAKQITISYNKLCAQVMDKPDPYYQVEVHRRDRAFAQED